MVELFIDGIKTVRSRKEIYLDFVECRLYNAIKGGFIGHPRSEIKEWLASNYNFKDDKEYGYMMDYIATEM